MKSKVQGVKGYWRRRGYKRLDTDESGSKRPRRMWAWKIRMPIKFRLKFKIKFSPKKLIAKVQEGYVKIMMRVANSRAVTSGGIGGYGGGGRPEFGMRPIKEYDEKMIIQMYNSLVMKQAQMMALEAEAQVRQIA
nr:hypothetical protein [Tanacetum cinerariifolium]GEV18611.1 hypothetical protein [Tanacetum cinerariifolium]